MERKITLRIREANHGLPLGSIATSMLCGGLIGGLLYRWRPRVAQHPLTGFCLALGVSLLRSGLIFFLAPHSPATLQRIEEIGMAPVLQGFGTALIRAIVEQVRERDEQTRAAALAEVRRTGEWLETSVSDNGQGVPSTEVEKLFFAERPRVHALLLLRRRLQGLFGRLFQLEVRSEIGGGTTVTMRIPLPKQFGVNLEAARVVASDARELAPT
jgi:LytS/YehU family sensor histidine kinase